MAAGRTIGALWRRALAEERPWPAYLVESTSGWQPVSWEAAGRRVDDLANGFLARGIGRGDTVAILGRTRLEWVLCDFALALVGAIAAPLYVDATSQDRARAIDLVRPKLVLADEGLMDDAFPLDRVDELEHEGRDFRAASPDALAAAESAVQEDDLYSFIFTSGATGDPKACMIRHRNYHVMTTTVLAVPGLVEPADTALLFLPLAHNFGRLVVLAGAAAGITIAFLPDPLRAAEALPEVRPTLFPSVPRLYEKTSERIAEQFADAPAPRRRLAEWALGVGRRSSACRRAGRSLPRRLAFEHAVANRLVYSRIRKRLGGRLRTAFSGGAPLRRDVAEFLDALGVPILEGYGLSECTTACALNRPGRARFGAVGQALPGFEIRIAADGEVEIRSDTLFAGYFGDEEATREAFTADGWLRSGDIGELDEDGFLTITDRRKDIIVTAGGKNIPPQKVESALRAAGLGAEALVIGDGRPYLVALVAPDGAGREAVQRSVDRANAGLAGFEQVKRFAILPREFSMEEGEVTPTLKLRRNVCERHFAAEIERLYAG